MQMKDGLTSSCPMVDHDAEPIFSNPEPARHRCSGLQQVPEQHGVLRRRIPEASNRPLRDDQEVGRRLGDHVAERHAMLVFVQKLRRDLLAQDAGEHIRRIVVQRCGVSGLAGDKTRVRPLDTLAQALLPEDSAKEMRFRCGDTKVGGIDPRRTENCPSGSTPYAAPPMALRIRPFTVALAGGSGSGKTSLTQALVEILGAERCSVLDHDSYYRDLSHLSLEARAENNFDHPDSLENELLARHLDDLRAGIAVQRPCYDFSTHSRRIDTTAVEPRPIILCEGILLLAVPELRSAFDLRVYVDTPADVRALRRVQRDIVERGRTVQSVVHQYMTSVRPMHERFVEPARETADLVLGWQHTPQEWAKTVMATLRGRMATCAGA
jgi:uridine kinase